MVVRLGTRRTSSDGILLDVVKWSVMIILAAAIIYPFWIMIVDSLSTFEAANSVGLRLWPRPATVEAYGEVFSQPIIYVAYFNTIFRTVLGTLLTVVVTLGMAYGLSKPRLPFVKFFTLMVVITMFFNGGIVPTFVLMKSLNLLNTRAALIVPLLLDAYAVLVMRSFLRNIPNEIEESAYIDGANELQILFRLVLPLSKPIAATVALWTAVLHWNEWFLSMIYSPAEEMTVLQLLLRRIVIENQFASMFEISDIVVDVGEQVPELAVVAATMFISIGPIVLAYPFLQRYFVTGLTLGAVKG